MHDTDLLGGHQHVNANTAIGEFQAAPQRQGVPGCSSSPAVPNEELHHQIGQAVT